VMFVDPKITLPGGYARRIRRHHPRYHVGASTPPDCVIHGRPSRATTSSCSRAPAGSRGPTPHRRAGNSAPLESSRA
jgi:hypothetical protein